MDKPGLLVITSSAIKGNIIKKALGEEYLIRILDHPEDALISLKHLRPELFILDDKALDVIDFCSEIRALPAYRNTPIMVITSNLKKSATRAFLKAGVTDCLREPFDEHALRQRIATAKRSSTTSSKMTGFGSKVGSFMVGNTTLKDRKVIDEQMVEAVQEAKDHHDQLSLLLVEPFGSVDHSDFEAHLKKWIRPQDLLSRNGEKQFAIILPRTSKKAASLIAENLSEAFETSPYRAHIGVANMAEFGEMSPDKSFNLMLSLASDCLNEEQQKGA